MVRRHCIYKLAPETLRQYWITCAKHPASYCTVARSDMIVVAQKMGEVSFYGSANEEG